MERGYYNVADISEIVHNGSDLETPKLMGFFILVTATAAELQERVAGLPDMVQWKEDEVHKLEELMGCPAGMQIQDENRCGFDEHSCVKVLSDVLRCMRNGQYKEWIGGSYKNWNELADQIEANLRKEVAA